MMHRYGRDGLIERRSWRRVMAGALTAVLGCGGGWLGLGAGVGIANASFEEPVQAEGGYVYTIPGWTLGPGTEAGVERLGSGFFYEPVPDGLQVGWMNTAGSVSQEPGAPLEAYATYTFSVTVGSRADTAAAKDYAIEFLAGGTILASTNVPLARGYFAPASVSYSVRADDPLIGQPVQLRITKARTVSGEQLVFDKASLLVARAEPLKLTPSSGAFVHSISVEMSLALAEATVRYTLDGSAPKADSAVYTGALTITNSVVVKAQAFQGNVAVSPVAERWYAQVAPILTGLVVPAGNADKEGTGTSGVLCTTPSLHQQAVYRAGDFTNGPVTIRELRYRRDALLGSVDATIPDVKVTLATTSRDEGTMVPSFADNRGADATEVFGGAWVLRSGTQGQTSQPAPFDLVLTLQRPFTYNPANGNLLVETRVGGSYGLYLDAAIDDDGASRFYAFNADAAIWSGHDTGAEVVQLGIESNQLGELLTTISPESGTFADTISVTLATTVAGGEVRYTTDGTIPQATSPKYEQALVLTATTTVKARAFVMGVAVTEVVEATYTKQAPGTVAVIVPGEYSQVEGEGWSGTTVTSPSLRMQQVFGAGHLPAKPVMLTGMRYRLDAAQGPVDQVIPGFWLALSTTTKTPGGLSAVFAENTGADQTVVYEGDYRIKVDAVPEGPGPRPFNVLIEFAKPFLYNPAQGNLLVDLRASPPAGTVHLDGCAGETDNASRAYAYNSSATTADDRDTGADVLQFDGTTILPNLILSPAAGAYVQRVEVTMLSGIAEGTIRYTLDGGEPTVESAAYAGAVRLIASATVKARVFTNGVPASEIVSAAYQITLTPAAITQQPQSQTVIEGRNVSLTVEATGSAPLAYQWLYNDTVLEGATNATLPLPAIKLAQAGTYKVRVSNDANTVTSDAAVLTVNPAPIPPTITQEPDNQSVVLGGRAVFRVVATGDQPMAYAWTRSGVTVYTAGPEYVLENVQPSLAGNYRVKVSNAAGYAYSRTVSLTVTDAPVAPKITKAPTHQLVALDASANFAVTVTGTTPLEYEWRRNGQPIPGATNAIYSVAQAKPADEGTYTVMVRNPLGVATTATGAVLDLVDLPGARVAFLNRMAGILDAPVLDADGTTRLAGPGFLAQLYAGPDAQSLAPIGPASPFQTAADAGYWDPGKTYVRTVPGVMSGSNVFAQVRAWETGAGTTFEQAYAGGRKTGKSAVLELATDPDGQSSAQLLGLLSFSLVYETEAPVVTITSPLAATVTDERFTLAGSAADNAGVASARWELNGAAMGPLELQNGQFSLPDQKLTALTNEVRVIAQDVSGNEGSAAVTVVWTPTREVALGSAATLENARVNLPLTVASLGEVGGMSFAVHYDPEQFRDVTFTWGIALAMGLREVNLETPGLVRGTFSLGGSALPTGTVTLGELSLRTRSVPTNLTLAVDLEVPDITDAAGNRLLAGTAVTDAQVVVLRRHWLGDNNGNDRLDVGDATIIQRFLAGLDPLRDGDVLGNDLNTSGDLDSGDVTKVLRVVVGLDEPTATPITAGGVVNQMQGPPDMVVVPVPLIAEAAAIVADPVSLSMGSIPPQAAPGGRVKVQLTLNQLATAPAFTGLSFDLAYPAATLKLVEAEVVPGLVPAGSVALWHDQGGRVKFAISSTAIWATGNGPVAEVTFEVLGLPADGNWRLEVSAMEIARAEGYELQTLSGTVWRLPPAPGSVWSAPVMTAKGLVFNFASQAEQSYAVEVSEDLTHWTLLATVPGTDGLTTFTDAEAGQLTMRFYRVKPAP